MSTRHTRTMSSAATTAAGEARDDDVEEGDDAVNDGGQDSADAVDDGHEDIADRAEDGFELWWGVVC